MDPRADQGDPLWPRIQPDKVCPNRSPGSKSASKSAEIVTSPSRFTHSSFWVAGHAVMAIIARTEINLQVLRVFFLFILGVYIITLLFFTTLRAYPRQGDGIKNEVIFHADKNIFPIFHGFLWFRMLLPVERLKKIG